jgi:DnaJ-class molecular chaperone
MIVIFKIKVNRMESGGYWLSDSSEENPNEFLCLSCDGAGEILQSDGSDSMGTWIDCHLCSGTGRKKDNDGHT